MATTTDGTRRDLVAAAEQLFATRGIDAVSLNEINRAAGQRNSSALQYHFGGRPGLLRAVLDKHRPDIESRRHALLDQYETAGVEDLHQLAAALVLPPAAKLADPDGGRAFLQVVAELANRPEPVIYPATTNDPADSVFRWRRLAEPLLTTETANVFHARFMAFRFAHTELAIRAAARPRRDDRLFTSRLVDLTTALLSTPLSAQTRRLLDERERRR